MNRTILCVNEGISFLMKPCFRTEEPFLGLTFDRRVLILTVAAIRELCVWIFKSGFGF